jgi:deoxyribodipyrimidine photo-lyase
VPENRICVRTHGDVRANGSYVLYWMTANRRARWNFALDRALHWARELKRPLLVLEAVRIDYPWASDRLHRFILDGMTDNAAAFAAAGIRYMPYVEDRARAGQGLIAALACDACLVVGDLSPQSFYPRMLTAAADHIPVRFETVDSNGLLPLSLAGAPAPTAYVFRRFLQRTLPTVLPHFPHPDPLAGCSLPRLARLPGSITTRWRPASAGLLAGTAASLAGLAIDHTVAAVPTRGGMQAAQLQLARFLDEGLPRYDVGRNNLEDDAASGLSPYLHFGHLSAHQVASAVLARAGWTPGHLATTTSGCKSGWWGIDAASEAYLDQVVTWRELGYTSAHLRSDNDSYDALPRWAQTTLDLHASDPRTQLYDLAAFAAGATHDPLWNAAQMQLRRDGTMHNYLRMLWGKKIIEWTAHPREAHAVMTELNNRYALDGRDPNSASGISWCLGRFDRPWAPERPIFGRIRYMSSASTRRKMRVTDYLIRYAP